MKSIISKSTSNNQFRLDLPAGWQDSTVHYFVGPEERGRQHMLTVSVDDNPSTNDLRAYVAIRRDQLQETMPDAEVLKDEARSLPSGLDAHELVCKLSSAQGSPTFRKQVFVFGGKKAYTFTADFSKRTMKTVGIEVEKIIESLEP